MSSQRICGIRCRQTWALQRTCSMLHKLPSNRRLLRTLEGAFTMVIYGICCPYKAYAWFFASPKGRRACKTPRNTLFRCGGCGLLLSSRLLDSMKAKQLGPIKCRQDKYISWLSWLRNFSEKFRSSWNVTCMLHAPVTIRSRSITCFYVEACGMFAW